MTCIIGGKCTDGIILVSDRKVIYHNGNVASREKIFLDYYPFIIGSSGDTTSFDNFRKKALELAQQSRGKYDNEQEFKPIPFDPKSFSGITAIYSNPTTYPVIQHNAYLTGLKKIVREQKADIKQNSDQYPFDVLIASQTDIGTTHLYYIDDNGVMNEIFDPYIIIGSPSAQFYGSMFVKPFFKTILSMNEFGQTAYFTIKYIDRFKIEVTIGLEGEKPLVYIVPKKGLICKAPDSLIQEWESNTNKMLDNYEKQGIHKLL